MDAQLSHEHNGGDPVILEGGEEQEVSVLLRQEEHKLSGVDGGSVTAAPWRQRARNRKGTSASTSMRALSDHDAPLVERSCQTKTPDQTISSLNSSDTE